MPLRLPPRLVPFIGLGAVVLGALALFFFARAILQSEPNPVIENNQPGIVRIEVEESGLYRLTAAELNKGGLGAETLTASNLRLTRDGRLVAYYLEPDGQAIIFYGQESDSRYSRFGTYLLETGQNGETMAVLSVQGTESPVETIPQRLHLEQNSIYDGRARFETAELNEIQGPWYWDTLQVQSTLSYSFDLPDISQEPGTVQVTLWGATHDASIENDHDFDIVINGQSVGTLRFDGEIHFQGQLEISAGILQSGSNEIILDNTVEGATLIDIMRLDWIDIIYRQPTAATADTLTIQQTNGTVSASGFSATPLVIDVSDPEKPTLLSGWTFQDETAEFSVQESQTILAVGPDGYLTPVAVSGLRQNNWRNPDNQAELIIVTTKALSPSLEPLVEARLEQGLRSAVVPVEEIYDSFGFGRPSPQAITAFVHYALENWAEPKPRYLFLVGESSYDFRGYLGDGPQNHVPSLMVEVRYSGETVSDSRLADIDGDFRPDLAVGRWPVDTPAAVIALIERTLAYESGQASSRTIFAADGTSPEFSSVSDLVLQESGLDETTAEKLYGVSAADLTDSWNGGAWLLNYTGHGSLDRWGQQDVFSTEAVGGLQKTGSPPIVIQLTCLTGFFAHPSIPSLSEVMLLNKNGPVLLVSATSLTLSSSQTPFGINLINELLNAETIRIGDALNKAKLDLDLANREYREISDTFGLLGDPSALIVRPGNTSVISPNESE